MGSFAPVGGAEGQDGEGQGESGQGQGEQGARAAGHVLQHGCTGPAEASEGRAKRSNGTEGVTVATDGSKGVGQMLLGGFKAR